jgi:thioredoxin-related protein
MRILYSLALMITASASSFGYTATDYVYEYEEEQPEAESIPELNSFEEVAKTARARGLPILVEFSTPWCRYCEALEQQVLKPLMRNGKYKNRIIVKKLEVNNYSSIAGFDGMQYRTDELSRMYNVDLYPTLVFFDANGEEISRRIVGITVLEYVAGELEKAISAAEQDTATAL